MTLIEKTDQAKTKNSKIYVPFKKMIMRNNEQNKIMNKLKNYLKTMLRKKKHFIKTETLI